MSPVEAKEFGLIDKILEHPFGERDDQDKSHLANPTVISSQI